MAETLVTYACTTCRKKYQLPEGETIPKHSRENMNFIECSGGGVAGRLVEEEAAK